MIRVLVVDDHPIVRGGLTAVLGDEPDLEVVGAAGSAGEALRLTRQTEPDIVLLDLELPDRSGVDVLPDLLVAAPNTRVIVFTAYGGDERVLAALRAGARGYLLKGASGEEIARSARSVYAGGTALDPRVAGTLLSDVGTRLTDRERDVLRLVASGLPGKAISRSLAISERTVKFHVTSILRKLDAGSRAQAVAVATQRGLL